MPWYVPVRCPVLWDELRRRVRGGRGHLVLWIYSVALVFLLIGASAVVQVGADPQGWAVFGRDLWHALLIGQLAVILVISPGLTAGAISTERERGTLQLLFVTPMSTLSLVVGKFAGAIGQMVLVALSGLPVVSVVLLYGGVSPGEILGGYLLILATGVLYSALGFLASCWCARMAAAVAWAYGLMLFVLVGAPLLGAFVAVSVLGYYGGDPWGGMLWGTNPFYALEASSGDLLQLSQAAVVMLGEGALLVLVSTGLVRRLRGRDR
jgi:ABC-type transport system involved in multi-copper enzyme maturation permease subunit